jgi:hypothetical protein
VENTNEREGGDSLTYNISKLNKFGLINIVLIALILVGIASGIYQALTVPITSDIVNPGLYAKEFWSGNQQFFVPVNDPYIIDYAIQLVTAPLSGYSARGLYIQSLLVYLVIILLAFLVVRNVSGLTAGLLAAGLVANVPVQALQYLVSPLYHGTTIMLILLALLAYQKLEGRLKTLGVSFILIVGSINDTLIIPMFTAPFLIYNIVRYRKDENALGMVIASLIGIIAFLIKRGELWPNGLYMVSVGGIGNIIGLQPQFYMLPLYLVSLTMMSGIIILIPLLAGLYVAVQNKESRPYVILVGLAALCMLGGFLFMYTSGGDLGRWLYPLPILAMIPISMTVGKTSFNNMLIVLIVGLLLVNNFTGMIGQDLDFNAKDRQLVEYLHSINVSHAYANYWCSNLLTYLDYSGQLKIAPVTIVDGQIQFLYIQSSIGWTNWGWPAAGSPVVDESPVIIAYSPGDPLFDWAQQVNNVTPPASTYVYRDYHTPGYENITIWVYKYNTSIPAWPVESLDDFLGRGVKPV